MLAEFWYETRLIMIVTESTWSCLELPNVIDTISPLYSLTCTVIVETQNNIVEIGNSKKFNDQKIYRSFNTKRLLAFENFISQARHHWTYKNILAYNFRKKYINLHSGLNWLKRHFILSIIIHFFLEKTGNLWLSFISSKIIPFQSSQKCLVKGSFSSKMWSNLLWHKDRS